MTYEVRVARRAESYLRRLDGRTQQRILGRLEQIADNPYGPQTKSLTNAAEIRAARVGDYRILLAVDEANRIVNVSVIGPRGAVYRDV